MKKKTAKSKTRKLTLPKSLNRNIDNISILYGIVIGIAICGFVVGMALIKSTMI